LNYSGWGNRTAMKLTRLGAVIAVILAICLSQDASGAMKRRFDCSKSVHKAIEKFQKKHFNEVKTILTDAKYQCSGSANMDTLLYYLGKADVMLKLPSEARVEIERLIQDFPTSAYSDEAHYLLGYCSFLETNPPERDQEKTHKAIRELTDFIDRFPESAYIDSAQKFIEKCMEKLAEKEFANAHFYEKIEQYDAAIVYFKSLIADFPQSKYVNQSKLAIAQNLIALSRPGEAQPILDELVSSLPAANDINRKAQDLIARIEKREQIGTPEKPGRKAGPKATPKSDTSGKTGSAGNADSLGQKPEARPEASPVTMPKDTAAGPSQSTDSASQLPK
jgi:outer membrane protein assembly factor BamD